MSDAVFTINPSAPEVEANEDPRERYLRELARRLRATRDIETNAPKREKGRRHE